MPDITTLTETEREIVLCIIRISYTEMELRRLEDLSALFAVL